jgi:hypothetical protein
MPRSIPIGPANLESLPPPNLAGERQAMLSNLRGNPIVPANEEDDKLHTAGRQWSANPHEYKVCGLLSNWKADHD